MLTKSLELLFKIKKGRNILKFKTKLLSDAEVNGTTTCYIPLTKLEEN